MKCEELIVKRFLEIFNEEYGTKFNFKNCVKKDELPEFRNKKTYDYNCLDRMSGKEIGIEVKRLIPEHRERIINLSHRVKEIEIRLKNSLEGDFLLIISPYQFKYKQAKTLKRIFNDVADEIASVGTSLPKGRLRNLSCFRGIGLIRLSESNRDFSLSFWPISFANANQKEISRALKTAFNKFKADLNKRRINIILLVEMSSVVQRTKINTMIKNLIAGIDEQEGMFGKKYEFNIIDGIYHIGIAEKPVIAQVFPKMKEFGFIPKKRSKQAIGLYKYCRDYFLR